MTFILVFTIVLNGEASYGAIVSPAVEYSGCTFFAERVMPQIEAKHPGAYIAWDCKRVDK